MLFLTVIFYPLFLFSMEDKPKHINPKKFAAFKHIDNKSITLRSLFVSESSAFRSEEFKKGPDSQGEDDLEMVKIDKQKKILEADYLFYTLENLNKLDLNGPLIKELQSVVKEEPHFLRSKNLKYNNSIIYSAIIKALSIRINMPQNNNSELYYKKHLEFINLLLKNPAYQAFLFLKSNNGITILDIIKQAKNYVPELYDLLAFYNYHFDVFNNTYALNKLLEFRQS